MSIDPLEIFWEKEMQKKQHDEVVLNCARYYIDYGWSIRKIADNVGLSKTTVHRYLICDLKNVGEPDEYDDLYVHVKNRLRSRRNWQKRDYLTGRYTE